MKARHAAALALVAWYLIAPHIGSITSKRNPATGFYDAYSTEPFCVWEITDSYDTAAEGRMALDKANQLAKQDCPSCSAIAVCIATNDPRLKRRPQDEARSLRGLFER